MSALPCQDTIDDHRRAPGSRRPANGEHRHRCLEAPVTRSVMGRGTQRSSHGGWAIRWISTWLAQLGRVRPRTPRDGHAAVPAPIRTVRFHARATGGVWHALAAAPARGAFPPGEPAVNRRAGTHRAGPSRRAKALRSRRSVVGAADPDGDGAAPEAHRDEDCAIDGVWRIFEILRPGLFPVAELAAGLTKCHPS